MSAINQWTKAETLNLLESLRVIKAEEFLFQTQSTCATISGTKGEKIFAVAQMLHTSASNNIF